MKLKIKDQSFHWLRHHGIWAIIARRVYKFGEPTNNLLTRLNSNFN